MTLWSKGLTNIIRYLCAVSVIELYDIYSQIDSKENMEEKKQKVCNYRTYYPRIHHHFISQSAVALRIRLAYVV